MQHQRKMIHGLRLLFALPLTSAVASPAVLQAVQLRQEQTSKNDIRDEESAAAHDRDYASLVAIVAPALSDSEHVQRLWRSIDITGNKCYLL
jgi:hypothetical protein